MESALHLFNVTLAFAGIHAAQSPSFSGVPKPSHRWSGQGLSTKAMPAVFHPQVDRVQAGVNVIFGVFTQINALLDLRVAVAQHRRARPVPPWWAASHSTTAASAKELQR